MEVWNVPHIVGRGGRVIRRIETVCGVFLNLRDFGDGKHEMLISGPRPACIFAEFAMELLSTDHHSVLTHTLLSQVLGPLLWCVLCLSLGIIVDSWDF